MEVRVDTFVESLSGARKLVNTAYVVMVALDENEHPMEVPGLLVETEEEKAEQRAIALKRYQEEEMRKLQQRNSRPKAAKPQPKPIQELSLFQGMEL